ncbi:MAG: hypothetical protein CK425_08160 [Parachlamydia sp.]|nr:MAG: hypothetical protein CK425_08160 [Parachlamydia sp.]
MEIDPAEELKRRMKMYECHQEKAQQSDKTSKKTTSENSSISQGIKGRKAASASSSDSIETKIFNRKIKNQ